MIEHMTEQEQETVKTYDMHAADWSASHSSTGFWQEELEDFRKFLPSGRILEIGAGGGRDAKELIAAGYDYRGSDISVGLLEEARKNNPGAVFDQVSVYDLNYDRPFDGFWCSAVLLHIPRDKLPKALAAIHRNMRLGAVGFMSVKEGTGERMEDEGGRRYFTYWSDKDFSERLARNGFEVLKRGYRPMSERTKWLTYIVSVGSDSPVVTPPT
jgi:SAM-dependent methyltransferase